MARSFQFTNDAFEEYIAWRQLDDDVVDKINALLKDISRDPFKGLGKPEPLKGTFRGLWSRRITKEHRLVYKVENDIVVVFKCFGHYDD